MLALRIKESNAIAYDWILVSQNILSQKSKFINMNDKYIEILADFTEAWNTLNPELIIQHLSAQAETPVHRF